MVYDVFKSISYYIVIGLVILVQIHFLQLHSIAVHL